MVVRRSGRALLTMVGLVAPLAVAAGLVPVRRDVSPLGAVLVLIVLVTAFAASGLRVAGLVAAVSAALWLDFFLVKPYDSWAIDRASNLVPAALVVAAGCLVTEARVRLQHLPVPQLGVRGSSQVPARHPNGKGQAMPSASQDVRRLVQEARRLHDSLVMSREDLPGMLQARNLAVRSALAAGATAGQIADALLVTQREVLGFARDQSP